MKSIAPALTFALFLAIASACSDRDSAPSADRMIVDAPIEAIDILVRESSPPGYTVHITSGLPSGCARFNLAEVLERNGATIVIRVTNTLPTGKDIACTAIYGYHETNLDLGQDFKPGQVYTVKVNDKAKTFTAQ
ncbi:MAG: hypothetical protein ABI782_03125 [Anaerolineaceae bacterium]